MLTTITTSIFATIASSVISWVGVEISKFLQQKTKNEKMNATIKKVTDITATVVSEISQTAAKELRATEFENKLNQVNKKDLKDMAFRKIIQQIPNKPQVEKELGINYLNEFINSKIEQAVWENKKNR